MSIKKISEQGSALVLIIFIVILVSGVSLFILERMGITNLVNLPSSSTSSTQNQAQTPLPSSSPTSDYQNPFDESSSTTQSYTNPFETYQNPFNNL